jgi:predicted HicB family RNase H-like nuclease
MVRVRPATDPTVAKEIEAFVESAEKPERPRLADEPKWKQRNREPKSHGFNLRLSKSQLQLLKAAAELQEISQQKFVERELWPLMEEKYGYLLED